MSDAPIQTHVNHRTWSVLAKARAYCEKVLGDVRAVCDDFLAARAFNPQDLCCVVVGSVGRGEALEASDIDLIPVLRSPDALQNFQAHDEALREKIKGTIEGQSLEGRRPDPARLRSRTNRPGIHWRLDRRQQ